MIAGERLPNFVLPDRRGQPQMAYALSLGEPLLLLLSPRPTAALLDALAAARLDDHRRVLVVAAPVSTLPPGIVELIDTDGRLGGHLGSTGPVDALLFDRNLRLRAHRHGLAAVLAWLGNESAPEPEEDDEVPAPLLVVPRVLDSDECRSLIARFESEAHVASGSLQTDDSGELRLRPEASFKARRDIVLDDQADRDWLGERIARTVLPELEHAFASTAAGFEWFKLVRYDAGAGWFRRHRDNVTPDAVRRRFAITINLNTGAYVGGNLVFPEYGAREHAPPAGAALVFSCSLAHEVTEVSSGRRYALLSFLLTQ